LGGYVGSWIETNEKGLARMIENERKYDHDEENQLPLGQIHKVLRIGKIFY
jgi:hypothetical protein